MTNLEKNARTYRLPEITTPENLACNWSCTVNFGDKILLAGYYYSGRKQNSYFGAVYEYTTTDHTCEGEIRLAAISSEMFADNGHAWHGAWRSEEDGDDDNAERDYKDALGGNEIEV